MRGWKKAFHANENQKKTGVAILISDKIDFKTKIVTRNKKGRDLEDGRGVRHGDHLPPYKYIRNTSTCGTTPTGHLLNVGRRPQTSQKARNSPRRAKEKRNNRDKRLGMRPALLGGSCEGGKVSTH